MKARYTDVTNSGKPVREFPLTLCSWDATTDTF